MSWIVEKKSILSYKNSFPKKFILISMPKSGGFSLEKQLQLNGYNIFRPKGLNLTGHYTVADTYLRLKDSKYSNIRDYLIPIRDTLEWRKSYFQYVKHQPVDSGMYLLSELFQKMTFEDYIENLVNGEFNYLNSINNLAVIPKGYFITNKLINSVYIKDVNFYIYDMTNGFSSLFKKYFQIEINNEIKENVSKISEPSILSKHLKNRLMDFDNIEFVNKKPYILLN